MTDTIMTDGTSLAVAAVIVGVSSLALYLHSKSKSKTNKEVTLVNDTDHFPLKLISKTNVSHNTRKFRFALPSENHVLGLPVGQYVALSAKIDGKLVVRPYTPTSSDDDLGFVDLIIKVYSRGEDPNFPDGGKMSQYLDQLKIGDSINFRGPSGLIKYKGYGKFEVKKDKKSEPVERKYTKISMLAGGTGATPMLQVIADILKHPEDKTQIRMIFTNRTEDDILCRDYFDEMAEKHPERFQIWYTLSKSSSPDWKYSIGRVDEKIIEAHTFGSGPDSAVLICGRLGFVKETCVPILEKLQHPKENIMIF